MNTKTIAVVGLGYVGLPLAVEFGKRFETIGESGLEWMKDFHVGYDL